MKHILFPGDDDDSDAPDVEQIHVTRLSSEGQQYCGYLFGAEELPNLQRVQELFGGGKYELIARSGGRIASRQRYVLDGKPRPLAYGIEADTAPPQVPVPAAPGSDTLQFLTLMMQQSSAQQAAQTQLMLGVMNTLTATLAASSSKESENARAFVQAMSSVQERAVAANGQLFQALLSAKGGGGGETLRVFREGMELGKEVTAAEPETDKDDVTDTLGKAFETMAMVGKLAGGSSNG